jgi:hypothetical protein
MRAIGFNARGRRLQYIYQMRQFIARLSPEAGIFNHLARQGRIDKYRLTIQSGNAPSFVIQRFDNPDRHGQLRKKA